MNAGTRVFAYVLAAAVGAGTVWGFFRAEHPSALAFMAAAAAAVVLLAIADFWLNGGRYALANRAEAKARRRREQAQQKPGPSDEPD